MHKVNKASELPQGSAEPTPEELAYISPLHHPFRTTVPLIIQAGTDEGFLDTIKEFADGMIQIDENPVKFLSTDFMSHTI